MKAIVQHRYGSTETLELSEIDRPAVRDGEVLVRARAAAVNPADQYVMRGEPYVARPVFGLRKPRWIVRGMDLAGTVEAVGAGVEHLGPGDEVYGWSRGSFAEYVSTPASKLALKPAGLSFEEAAAVPNAGSTALIALRDVARVQTGQKVLINGASGGIGTFAVQIARASGAVVTGVCSTANVELVRSLGADHVIDYTRDDFTGTDERYDVVLDNVENHPLSKVRRLAVPGGTVIPNNGEGGRWIGSLGRLLRGLVVSPFVPQKIRNFVAGEKRELLDALTALIDDGSVRPVIDRTYQLAEAADAMRYHGQGHARGKVVVTI